MNTDELFSGSGQDPYFLTARNAQGYTHIRQECERLWEEHRPYAQTDFCERFSKGFHEMFWEMYVRDRLSRHHSKPEPRNDDGPDFIFTGPPRVAVEATVASRGNGPDAVPDIRYRDEDDDSVPFEQCVLRITQALSDKSEANSAREHALKGAYVVAINLAFPEAWLGGFPSLSAMATLGATGAVIDLSTGRQRAGGQTEVKKKNGRGVPVIGFRDGSYAHISALIVASVTPFSSAYSNPSVEVLHNPRATKKLPPGWVPFGTEYWVEGNELKWVQHD